MEENQTEDGLPILKKGSDETEALDESQKKNPFQSSSEPGPLESGSTESPSDSGIPSISKPTKEDNISTVKAGQIDALKEKTYNQFLKNPVFADSNPNAQRNRDIYFNTLRSKGYSNAQINDLKLSGDKAIKAIQGKRLVEENAPKLNPSFEQYPGAGPYNKGKPFDIDAAYKTAVGLTGMGKYDQAINLFNATLGHLTPDKQDMGNSAQQDAMAGNIITQKSAATNPSNSLYGIGYALSSKKDYEGSIDYYNQALQADPTNVNAQKGLAYSKAQLGLKDEAKAHLSEARKMEQGNRANEALVGQVGEQAADEAEKQRQSDQMKTTADALEAFVLGDPEGKLGKFGYLNPIGKWYSGIVKGERTVGEGVKEIAKGEIVSGGLTTTLGLAETAFAAIPEVNAFNEVVVGIKSAAEVLPEEEKEVVNKALDFPFQAVSVVGKAMGIDPEEGSNSKKIMEILDIVASFGTMKLIHSGAEKVSGKVSDVVSAKSSIRELQDLSQKVAEGKATPQEISSLKEATSAMENVTLESIKEEAAKRDTPESKEIVEKIDDVKKENAVSPKMDKLHQELADLEAEVEKPMSPEAKDILNQKIADKKGEIAAQAHDEVNSHIDDSMSRVSEAENEDRIGELDTRMAVLKVDLEASESEVVKLSLSERIKDLEKQKDVYLESFKSDEGDYGDYLAEKNKTTGEYVYKTSNGQYTIKKGTYGLQIFDKDGKEPSYNTKLKIIKDYEQKFNYNEGKRALDNIEGISEAEVDKWVADKSENPGEIIDAYSRVKSNQPYIETDHKTEKIAESIGKIKSRGYIDIRGREHVTNSKARSYFNERKGVPIDILAQEISGKAGMEVTPEDIADFIDEFPNGVGDYEKSIRNPLLIDLKNRFKQITGLDLNSRVIDSYLKFDEKAKEYIDKNFESYEEARQAYIDAIERGDIEFQEPWNSEGTENVGNEVSNGGGQKETIEQRAVKSVESSVPGKKRDKSFINRMVKESSAPEGVKAEIEKNGLECSVFSNEVAQKIADTIVEDFKKEKGDQWHDAAINFASRKIDGVPLSINAGILGRVIGDFIEREKATNVPEQKKLFASQAAEVAMIMDENARDFGRFGSMLAKVYEMTPLGIEARIKKQIERANDKKLDESFKGGKTRRQKIKEAYSEFNKDSDIEKAIAEGVESRIEEIYKKLPTERRKKADKAIAALSNIQKKIKANSYSSIIPPDVITAGIEVIKQSIKAGVEVADAVESGINYIKKKYQDWDKEHLFRKDMLEGFKEEGVEVGEKSKGVDAQLKVLDKIFPKKRIENPAKRKKLHEKIVEAYNAGALDYEKFEKLFYDKFGLADVDNGVVKEFLQKQAERIHNAADGGLKEREYTAMLNFLENHKKQNKMEWVTTPFYANILSGYETHLNNAQFNIWSTVAQTALLAVKNPIHARYLANQMLNAIPQGLKEGGNILKTGLKFGEPAKAESLAERRADKGVGISHYYKLPVRLLRAGDAIFNTPIRAMKRAELLLEIANNYNESLPKEQRKSKAEIQADINDIVFNTTERKAEAYDQAVKDIQKLEGKDVDLNDPKIQRDIKLRQFEIMENSRPADKYADLNIDKDAVNEEAKDFANRSLLLGKPVGSLGALSTVFHNLSEAWPISKFAVTTFVDVPLNLANMMIDKSPLGLARMALYEARGRRGVFTSREFADKNNIKLDLTPDQRKEAWLRAANYTAALVGVAGLAYTTYTDKNGKKRPILDVTADGTGDYRKNRALEQANGYKEYTADFMGYKFNYKYNSILASILTPIGAVKDYENYIDKNPATEKELVDKVAYGLVMHMAFTGNQANLQGWRDMFGTAPGKAIDEDNWSEKVKDWGAKSGGKILRNMVVPNFAIQANKDVKGLLDMADKKPTEAMDYLLKDVPFVESMLTNKIDHLGRDVKSQFYLPVALVPDKLNMSGNDPMYKMFVDKKYYPRFATDKTVFDGNDEITLSDKQMNEVNKMRGKYVLDKLESKDEIKGKTYRELLESLSDEKFKEEMNSLFKEGELKAKSKIVGLDVEKKIKTDSKEKQHERKLKGTQRLIEMFELHRKKG